MTFYRNDIDWCGYCQEKPETIKEVFSNVSMRRETIKCIKCGSTLAIYNWLGEKYSRRLTD